VTRKISEAISDSVDVALGTFVQWKTHVLDIWLTWGASVFKGVMDVAQKVDWQNCKVPVVDTGLQSLGLCACGDQPYSIPAEEKKRGWSDQAFWCSGILMLNEGYDSDLLVWNPFSIDVREFPGLTPKSRKTKEKAIRFLCIAAVDPNSDGYWMKLSQWNRFRHDTFKERRDEELPFIPKAAVATVVNAAANAAACAEAGPEREHDPICCFCKNK
jgi:hypothetical protein